MTLLFELRCPECRKKFGEALHGEFYGMCRFCKTWFLFDSGAPNPIVRVGSSASEIGLELDTR